MYPLASNTSDAGIFNCKSNSICNVRTVRLNVRTVTVQFLEQLRHQYKTCRRNDIMMATSLRGALIQNRYYELGVFNAF